MIEAVPEERPVTIPLVDPTPIIADEELHVPPAEASLNAID